MKRVLVTGATGFLGHNFVQGLLADPEVEIYLLTRDKPDAPAAQRMEALGFADPRCHAVAGQITDPQLPRLADGLPVMDEFWHIAGLTDFHESKRDQLFAVNVEGTRNALALAERVGASRFFHVSTAYVAGICEGPVPEDGLRPAPRFRNAYEESKYAAEALVRASPLRWFIIRPSIIMGDSETGEAETDTGAYGVLKTLHGLRRLVDREYRDCAGPPPGLRYHIRCRPEIAKNVVYVDDVVRLMLAVRRAGLPRRTYHATAPSGLVLQRVLETMIDVVGAGYVTLSPHPHNGADPKQRFLDKGVRVYEPYLLLDDPNFDMSNACALWQPRRLGEPELRFLCQRYVRKLDEENLRRRAAIQRGLDLRRLADVQRYGSFALAYDTMSRDLSIFRTPGCNGYAAYTRLDQTAIMIGDPVAEDPDGLLRDFLRWCRENNLNLCALQISLQSARTLRALGLAVNKLGIETHIDLTKFDDQLRGQTYQDARTALHVAARHGITCAERALGEVWWKQVQRVSDAWIARKHNRAELRVLVRPLSPDPEPGVRCFFAERQDRLLAFIFFNPIYRAGQVLGYYANVERYDLSGEVLPGRFNAMRFITYCAALKFKSEGLLRLDLGLSPLYGVADSEFNDNQELLHLLQRLYEEDELYAFKGIARHKRMHPARQETPAFIAMPLDTGTEDTLNVFKAVGLLES